MTDFTDFLDIYIEKILPKGEFRMVFGLSVSFFVGSNYRGSVRVPPQCQRTPGNKGNTPPKFNIATEKWSLEDEFPFGIAYF